jgi:hypothetical protein
MGGDDVVETDKGHYYFVVRRRGLWSGDGYCIAARGPGTARRQCQQPGGSANNRNGARITCVYRKSDSAIMVVKAAENRL